MERDLSRRLYRIENKINVVARAVSFVLALAFGFAVYFLMRGSVWGDWAAVGGFIAGTILALIVDRQMRQMEKVFPDLSEE